jgi:hypothetical protein
MLKSTGEHAWTSTPSLPPYHTTTIATRCTVQPTSAPAAPATAPQAAARSALTGRSAEVHHAAAFVEEVELAVELHELEGGA